MSSSEEKVSNLQHSMEIRQSSTYIVQDGEHLRAAFLYDMCVSSLLQLR